jgi:hypothetical protein
MVRLALIALLALIASTNNTLSDTDTVMRAAYCVGVLKQRTETFFIPKVEHCAATWAAQKYKSLADCQSQTPYLARMATGMLEDFQKKRKRYAQYVSLFISDTNNQHRLPMVRGLIAKGEADAKNSNDQLTDMCQGRCPNDDHVGSCFIQCLEVADQVEANMARCQFWPDKLPF